MSCPSGGAQPSALTDALMSPIERYLHALDERFRELDDGTVATDIPELAKADPRWLGRAIAARRQPVRGPAPEWVLTGGSAPRA